MARLADEGWLVAVHEGRWNPTALIGAVARAIDQALLAAGDPVRAAAPRWPCWPPPEMTGRSWPRSPGC
jgi:hypothetical protein